MDTGRLATQLATLRAVIDCIIPADDWPSATQNEVDVFIVNLVEGDLRAWREDFIDGLDRLEADVKQTGASSFMALPAEQQVGLLTAIERHPQRAAWFETLVRITNEGYYADPSNGANPDMASWRMVGFDPRLPPAAMKRMLR